MQFRRLLRSVGFVATSGAWVTAAFVFGCSEAAGPGNAQETSSDTSATSMSSAGATSSSNATTGGNTSVGTSNDTSATTSAAVAPSSTNNGASSTSATSTTGSTKTSDATTTATNSNATSGTEATSSAEVTSLSDGTSASSSDATTSQTPVGPVGELPVASGACAANTGLGKGSSTEYPCAALEDGRVACFDAATATFLNYQGGAAVNDAVVATGNGFSVAGCLINRQGAVHCWDNADVSTTPVIASGALELTGGQGKNCALVDGSPRTVQCWTGGSGTPETVNVGAEPTMVSCGYSECCAVTTEGAVACWTSPVGSPAAVAADFDAKWVGTGQSEKCAVDGAGAAYCWGENWNGQLGLPNMMAQTTPVAATFDSGVVATASGQFHSCFLFADGTVQCTGGGQVNGAGGGENTPTAIAGINTAVAISVAKHASCAVLRDGEVKCWGDNSGGPTPVTITAAGEPIRARVPEACR